MNKRSRTEYSVLNIFTGLAGYGLNTAIGFVCRIIFVRTLAVDYLGVSGLFTNVLSMLSLAELGISSAIIYALYKPIAEDDKKKITSIMYFYKKAYLLIGSIVAVIGLAILPFLDVIINEPPEIKENIYGLYLLYLLSTVISYFFSYRASLLTAMQRQYVVSSYNYVVTIMQSIAQTIFLLVTHEYLPYLIIQTIGGVTYNVWVSHKAKKDYPYIVDKKYEPLEKEEKRTLLKNIKALAVNKFSGVLVNSTDNIAITFFTGLASVGFASNYVTLSSMLGSLIGQVFNALPGSVGNLNATADEEGRYKFYKVLYLLNFWLFGWAAIGMVFVSGDMVSWFYGADYVLPIKIPLIIAINSYTIGMLQATYTYKSTLGLFKYGQYLLFFTGIINIVLDVILGRIWGVFGIYVATLIARVCTNLWYEPYAVFKYGLKKSPILYWKRYFKYLLVLIIASICCWGLCRFCHFPIVINVFVKIAICSVVPNMIFVLAFRKTEEYEYLKGRVIWLMNSIKRKLMRN